MPEVIIKYKNRRTLEALKDFSKYFDFEIAAVKSKTDITEINGVAIIPGDSSINIDGMKKIFTGKNISANELRRSAWNRKK
jgi:glutamine amidotransferase PdxT